MATFPEGNTTTLRMIDFFTIPKDAGDVVVLLLAHPGLNLLSRHLPSSKINDLLLSEVMPATTAFGDVYMMGIEEPDLEEIESLEIIDLASFLECVHRSPLLLDPDTHANAIQICRAIYSLLRGCPQVRMPIHVISHRVSRPLQSRRLPSRSSRERVPPQLPLRSRAPRPLRQPGRLPRELWLPIRPRHQCLP